MITAVVPGIVTITSDGTSFGTADDLITTGLIGKVETMMYYDGGANGIEFGVTNGTVY
jgi:hypothetical protein